MTVLIADTASRSHFISQWAILIVGVLFWTPAYILGRDGITLHLQYLWKAEPPETAAERQLLTKMSVKGLSYMLVAVGFFFCGFVAMAKVLDGPQLFAVLVCPVLWGLAYRARNQRQASDNKKQKQDYLLAMIGLGLAGSLLFLWCFT